MMVFSLIMIIFLELYYNYIFVFMALASMANASIYSVENMICLCCMSIIVGWLPYFAVFSILCVSYNNGVVFCMIRHSIKFFRCCHFLFGIVHLIFCLVYICYHVLETFPC